MNIPHTPRRARWRAGATAAAALASLMLVAGSALAQTANVTPTASQKDTEIQLARRIETALKLQTSLKLVGNDSENLRVHINFQENAKSKMPRMVVILDTHALNRTAGKDVVAMTISLSAVPLVVVKPKKTDALLNWLNVWNGRPLPARAYLAGKQVVFATHLLTTEKVNTTEEAVLQTMTALIQTVPAALAQMRTAGLIEDGK